jgi:hypothetical protein
VVKNFFFADARQGCGTSVVKFDSGFRLDRHPPRVSAGGGSSAFDNDKTAKACAPG